MGALAAPVSARTDGSLRHFDAAAIEEESRLGATEDRLNMVERLLEIRQKRRIGEIKLDGGETNSAERALQTIEMTQGLFEEYRALIFHARERRRPWQPVVGCVYRPSPNRSRSSRSQRDGAVGSAAPLSP